jgi:hypothetical protein
MVGVGSALSRTSSRSTQPLASSGLTSPLKRRQPSSTQTCSLGRVELRQDLQRQPIVLGHVSASPATSDAGETG